MLLLVDSFLTEYLSHLLPASNKKIKSPLFPVKPSITHQIVQSETIIDPYFKSLQRNYYYPLSSDTMTTSVNEDAMRVDGVETVPPSSLGSRTIPLTKAVTFEDSMETISELIQEIQSSDPQDISSHVTIGSIPPLPPSKKRRSLRVSLARQSKLGGAPSSPQILSRSP
jgi:hypothetical protein